VCLGSIEKGLDKKCFLKYQNKKQQPIIKAMVKLNKNQLGGAIKSLLREENGLNEVFKLIPGGLMPLEREGVVRRGPGNKGNGHRQINRLGQGFKPSIPRDRLGVPSPMSLNCRIPPPKCVSE
jgi:hypothetical protein